MRGIPYNTFGANFETAGPGSANFTNTTLKCLFHWWWRVNSIDIDFSFTKAADATSISGSFNLAKVFPSTSPAEYVSFEYQLVTIRPGAATAPFYESVISAIELFNAGIFRQRIAPVDDVYKIDHEFRCNQVGSAWSVNEVSANPAGTWAMNATDPIDGTVYDLSGDLFSDEADISGTLTITPSSFYPYNDVDGNPRYDTTTGAYA